MIKNQINTFRINRFNNFILTLIFICTFFSGYLNTSIPIIILIFYIFLVYLFEIKITYIQMIIIFIFISYSILIMINSLSWLSSLINLKWFYGIIFFLILFRIENVRIFFYQKLSSNKLFLFFLFLLIFETFLINFIFSPNEFYLQESSSSEIGFYNRPLGLAGNSSATATLIIAWYFSLNIKKNKNFIFLTYTFVIFCLMSGTGFILYILSIVISQWSQILKNKIILKILIGVTIIVFLFFFYFIFTFAIHQKISFLYYIEVLTQKYSLLKLNYEMFQFRLLENNLINIIFGYSLNSEIPLNASDFGWLNLLNSQGLFGFLIFILLIVVFNNKNFKKNRISILILILGGIHYSVIFLVPGQILLTKLISKQND